MPYLATMIHIEHTTQHKIYSTRGTKVLIHDKIQLNIPLDETPLSKSDSDL